MAGVRLGGSTLHALITRVYRCGMERADATPAAWQVCALAGDVRHALIDARLSLRNGACGRNTCMAGVRLGGRGSTRIVLLAFIIAVWSERARNLVGFRVFFCFGYKPLMKSFVAMRIVKEEIKKLRSVRKTD